MTNGGLCDILVVKKCKKYKYSSTSYQRQIKNTQERCPAGVLLGVRRLCRGQSFLDKTRRRADEFPLGFRRAVDCTSHAGLLSETDMERQLSKCDDPIFREGAIEACDMMRYSRQYARAFRPVLGREEYYIYMAVNQPRGGRSPSCAGGGGVCPERKAGEYGPIAPRVGESSGGIQEKWMGKRAAAKLRQPFRFSVVGKIADFPTMQERINVLRSAQVGRFWGPVWRKCFYGVIWPDRSRSHLR